jgi:hypothetical protein
LYQIFILYGPNKKLIWRSNVSVTGTGTAGEKAQWSIIVPLPLAEVPPANAPHSVTVQAAGGDGK